MCTLTFSRRFRYNTFELSRDGASATAESCAPPSGEAAGSSLTV